MARSFTGSERITGAITLGTSPYTVNADGQSTSTTAEQYLAGFGDPTAIDNGAYIGFRGDIAGDPIQHRFTRFFAGEGGSANSSSSYVANTWYSCQAQGTSTTDHSIWKDGTETTSTTTVTVTGGTQVTIGAFVHTPTTPPPTYSSFLSGVAAKVAVWDVALSDDEIASLAKGFSPRRIRPQSLLWYAPLVREVIELKGAALTDTGPTTAAVHPRSYGI